MATPQPCRNILEFEKNINFKTIQCLLEDIIINNGKCSVEINCTTCPIYCFQNKELAYKLAIVMYEHLFDKNMLMELML